MGRVMSGPRLVLCSTYYVQIGSEAKLVMHMGQLCQDQPDFDDSLTLAATFVAGIFTFFVRWRSMQHWIPVSSSLLRVIRPYSHCTSAFDTSLRLLESGCAEHGQRLSQQFGGEGAARAEKGVTPLRPCKFDFTAGPVLRFALKCILQAEAAPGPLASRKEGRPATVDMWIRDAWRSENAMNKQVHCRTKVRSHGYIEDWHRVALSGHWPAWAWRIALRTHVLYGGPMAPAGPLVHQRPKSKGT